MTPSDQAPASQVPKRRLVIGAISLMIGAAIVTYFGKPITEKADGRLAGVKQKRKSKVTRVHHRRNEDHDGLDFLVAGFSKCGTSSLMNTFAAHEEVDMPEHEYCYLTKKLLSDEEVYSHFKEWRTKNYLPEAKVTEMDGQIIRGMKCPTAIRSTLMLDRLKKLNPRMRVVVGVRHPVLFFQSFYNFRVSHRLKIKDGVPDPMDLIGGHDKEWQGVYTDLARYEDSLQQMGKVDLSSEELKHLASQGLSVSPSHLPVFLYEVGQLADPDFQSDLQDFLGLEQPLPEIEHRNVHEDKKYPETMDICDEKFDSLRHLLISHGTKTRHWIRDTFIKSDEVFIGGDMDRFLELIAAWDKDPCLDKDK